MFPKTRNNFFSEVTEVTLVVTVDVPLHLFLYLQNIAFGTPISRRLQVIPEQLSHVNNSCRNWGYHNAVLFRIFFDLIGTKIKTGSISTLT